MKFRAAVLDRVGEALSIDSLEMAPLAPGDVLVKVRASGLCHTDLEVIQGALAYPLPIVLGHEGAGVVEAVGSAVSRVKKGDHVICSWNPHCGHCFYCERAVPILCEPFTRHQPKGRLLDGTTRMSRDPAEGVVDSTCRVHGVENLYITGASVFPTAAWKRSATATMT